MRLVGIIGGVGPESTIDYYKLLIETYQARRGDDSYPPIIINSIDLSIVVRFVTSGDLGSLTSHLAAEVQRLANAGATFGAIAANTPHIVFDALQSVSAIPLVSIVGAACQGAKARRLRRLALLGTRFTMTARFYPEVFEAENIELVTPRTEEQSYIHEKYMNELIKGSFAKPTREGFERIIERMRDEEAIDGVILAGTELPLLLRESSTGMEMLDTTRLHVEAIIDTLLR